MAHLASRKSPHDWLVRLSIDLAMLCDIWSSKQPELMPFGHFQFSPGAAHHFVATHHHLPYRSTSDVAS